MEFQSQVLFNQINFIHEKNRGTIDSERTHWKVISYFNAQVHLIQLGKIEATYKSSNPFPLSGNQMNLSDPAGLAQAAQALLETTYFDIILSFF